MEETDLRAAQFLCAPTVTLRGLVWYEDAWTFLTSLACAYPPCLGEYAMKLVAGTLHGDRGCGSAQSENDDGHPLEGADSDENGGSVTSEDLDPWVLLDLQQGVGLLSSIATSAPRASRYATGTVGN